MNGLLVTFSHQRCCQRHGQLFGVTPGTTGNHIGHGPPFMVGPDNNLVTVFLEENGSGILLVSHLEAA